MSPEKTFYIVHTRSWQPNVALLIPLIFSLWRKLQNRARSSSQGSDWSKQRMSTIHSYRQTESYPGATRAILNIYCSRIDPNILDQFLKWLYCNNSRRVVCGYVIYLTISQWYSINLDEDWRKMKVRASGLLYKHTHTCIALWLLTAN